MNKLGINVHKKIPAINISLNDFFKEETGRDLVTDGNLVNIREGVNNVEDYLTDISGWTGYYQGIVQQALEKNKTEQGEVLDTDKVLAELLETA